MSLSRPLYLTLATGLVLSLGACSGVRDQLGLTKQSPDEFKVVSRAPLSIPPEFNLRPPQPGQPRPQEGTVQQQARTAVFRATDQNAASLDEVIPNDGRSVGERSLLRAAGADQADANIRRVVEQETREINEESEGFINNLVFWRKSEPTGNIVDANAESKRLQENAALGRDVTSGETPTIERKKKALLEGIF